MSRPRFSPLTPIVERDRSARVIAELAAKIRPSRLLIAAADARRIHPDLAAGFVAAAVKSLNPEREP